MLKKVPNALLVIAGQPHPAYSSQYVAELADLAGKLGVSRAVRFADRYLSAAELEFLFVSAEVFVCAHTSEGQSSSGTLALAMAAGAVPVSTPFAQAKELVANGRGVLVPFRSPGAVADAVRRPLITRCLSSLTQCFAVGRAVSTRNPLSLLEHVNRSCPRPSTDYQACGLTCGAPCRPGGKRLAHGGQRLAERCGAGAKISLFFLGLSIGQALFGGGRRGAVCQLDNACSACT